MCVAISGKVVSTDGETAKIDYKGNIITAGMGIVDTKVGDYCLVHAGCVIEIISPERAGEVDELISLIEEAYNDNITTNQ